MDASPSLGLEQVWNFWFLWSVAFLRSQISPTQKKRINFLFLCCYKFGRALGRVELPCDGKCRDISAVTVTEIQKSLSLHKILKTEKVAKKLGYLERKRSKKPNSKNKEKQKSKRRFFTGVIACLNLQILYLHAILLDLFSRKNFSAAFYTRFVVWF